VNGSDQKPEQDREIGPGLSASRPWDLSLSPPKSIKMSMGRPFVWDCCEKFLSKVLQTTKKTQQFVEKFLGMEGWGTRKMSTGRRTGCS